MLLVLVYGIAMLLSAQPTIDPWKIVPGTEGKSATMSYNLPSTSLLGEGVLEIAVDGSASATTGSIKAKTGITHPLTPGEVALYWSDYKGDDAYWNWRATQNGIAAFTSVNDPLPSTYVGQMARVITKDNNRYIGILSAISNTPDWFALAIKGSRLLFYRSVVKEIQELK